MKATDPNSVRRVGRLIVAFWDDWQWSYDIPRPGEDSVRSLLAGLVIVGLVLGVLYRPETHAEKLERLEQAYDDERQALSELTTLRAMGHRGSATEWREQQQRVADALAEWNEAADTDTDTDTETTP